MAKYSKLIAAGKSESTAGDAAHKALSLAERGPDRVVFGRIDEIKTSGAGGIHPLALERAITQAKRYAKERGLERFTVIFYDCSKLGGKFYFSGRL